MAPHELETVSAQELLERPLEALAWLVEGLVPVGLILLVGSPKVGKSWFAALLALCVSAGIPFLDHATVKAGVLYLCLEDTFARVQQRLFRLTDSAEENLRFCVVAETLSRGLIKQLENHLEKYPDTRLFIIDTLQTIRSASNDSMYAADYADLRILKRFADQHKIALLLVHHTRKMPDAGNVFNMISGSNGLMGAADQAMILVKSEGIDGQATLTVTGRDIENAEFKLQFNDCKWILIEKTSREELQEREVPSCIFEVIDFMASRTRWEGTATVLLAEAGIEDVKANVLAKRLNEYSSFLRERSIIYDHRRNGGARLISLIRDES